jgi:hypothetical protein
MDNFDVSPFDNNLLIVSQGVLVQNPGIFVSLDRGKTWSKNNRIMGQPDKITQLEFDLHDETTLWISVMGSGFYRGYFPKGAETRKIIVSPGTAELGTNKTLQLDVHSQGINGELVFKSANKSVATVSPEGLVTGKKYGAVKIWVTSEDGQYSDFVYLVVTNIVGTETIRQSNIKVYPNPANKKLYVQGIKQESTLFIYTSNGVLCKQQNWVETEGMDISALINGVYLYRVETKDSIHTGKFVKL